MCPATDDLRDAPRPRHGGRESPARRGSRPGPVDDEARLEELSYDECLALLRVSSVARVGVVVNGAPIVLPVNYRLVESLGPTWLTIRTRPGNVIDRGGLTVALEIDDIDPASHEGWSVLVRGTLSHVDPDAADFRARFDPEPWIEEERDSWLVIEPFSITGRRLVRAHHGWAFHLRGYL
jgi:nitroimidazol reductase NimA-like FMN-containing flavoprotein (pyridoxamine 5'-phosphate oxidase superfamily)